MPGSGQEAWPDDESINTDQSEMNVSSSRCLKKSENYKHCKSLAMARADGKGSKTIFILLQCT